MSVQKAEMHIFQLNHNEVINLNKNLVQKTINDLHYWDAAVKNVECNYFADEVTLVQDDEDGDVTYKFFNCYKVHFNHYMGYEKDKHTKELSFAQIPYFLQDVQVDEIMQEQKLYSCKLLLPPLEIIIWCKDIQITKQEKSI